MDGHADKTKERQVVLRCNNSLAVIVAARRPIRRGRFPSVRKRPRRRRRCVIPYGPEKSFEWTLASTFFEKSAIRIAVDRR